MKVLIIDDESHARNVLATLLEEECNGVENIYQATNLSEGVSIIKSKKPQLILLDIEMPQQSGLEILDYFKGEPIDFKIVFTTAYNQYAIEAFKTSAVDYLLKPIDSDELKSAVNKVKVISENLSVKDKILTLEKSFQQLALNKIALDLPRGIKFISHDKILFFEADGVYTKVHLVNGSSETICKTLKHFTDQLADKPLFYKPHRSYLINLKFMDELIKKDGIHIVMQNKRTIPIARDRKDAFLKMINNTF
ncbi:MULTISPECIES: LytTR family DNA-binding domain-containing protein [Polaribacter]|uniref:LytTR family DNA-binding domain-containing protein n=1 Tax=Polaribacter marinaquae TaxID=1642819 RepID=A0ABZ2TR28_9FLAO|nr:MULTISPECIES: LytTR family DNA-binding domain-containing protein [unclassified Polaribacter]AQS93655.1 DNA-binding response regulator [Polaribacter sp. BM10]SHM76547.1 two component transcriptional regulator, LytTR family [Polaribacter sp. KT 15]